MVARGVIRMVALLDDHVTGMVVTKWIVTLLECSYF